MGIIKTRQEKERRYNEKVQIARLKTNYITNLVNGRYYIARCNIIATQLKEKKIEETLDGRIKSVEYMHSEYALMKLQAIKSFREVHFVKQELMKFKIDEKEIKQLENDYYNGRIIRESYDEEYKKRNKAEFVAPS